MKIVAGMGAIDDYVKLVEAGADEVFCGFVPYEWNEKYGNLFPLNRREVLYYNIQINAFEDMRILRKMVDVYNVPVSITFNYLYYLEEQYKEVESIIKALINIGFNEFIIADIALILYLRQSNIPCNIQLSGETAELNSLSIAFFNNLNISRYVFHRKNTIKDMECCISNNEVKGLEYEAFILNEKCHFSGAFCSSIHCDEMIHLCKMPYELAKINEDNHSFLQVHKRIEKYYSSDKEDDNSHIIGGTGCGICYLGKLKEAGVTHLKVVGRGKFIEAMEEDIRCLKRAIRLLEINSSDKEFTDKVEEIIFKGKCSGNCYYK